LIGPGDFLRVDGVGEPRIGRTKAKMATEAAVNDFIIAITVSQIK
jgi:hypothetical protein